MVSQRQKMMISIMSGLLFFIVANPETFKLVRRILGGWVSSPTGCPTVSGLVVHAIVYFLLTWALMNMKQNRESADGDKVIPADTTPPEDVMPSSMSNEKDDSTPPEDVMPSSMSNEKDDSTSNASSPNPYNVDDGDQELSGIDTTFKLDMGSPHDQLNKYNRCACMDGTEVLVLK